MVVRGISKAVHPHRAKPNKGYLMDKLLPCPFCGGAGIVEVTYSTADEIRNAVCECCGAKGPVRDGAMAASKIWNTRTVMPNKID